MNLGGIVPDYVISAPQLPSIVSYSWTCLLNSGSFQTGTGSTFTHTSNLPAGTFEYFVTVQTVDGCTLQSNTITIVHDDTCKVMVIHRQDVPLIHFRLRSQMSLPHPIVMLSILVQIWAAWDMPTFGPLEI